MKGSDGVERKNGEGSRRDKQRRAERNEQIGGETNRKGRERQTEKGGER